MAKARGSLERGTMSEIIDMEEGPATDSAPPTMPRAMNSPPKLRARPHSAVAKLQMVRPHVRIILRLR